MTDTGHAGRRRAMRWPLAGAALAVVLAIAWYFASPWWTLRQLRAAADAGDAAVLSERIDFPAVRQSLKDEVKAELARDTGAGKGVEGLGAAMAMAVVDPLIDGLVTPQAMARVVRSGRLERGSGAKHGSAGDGPPGPVRRATGGSGAANAKDPDWRVTRDGLSRFSVRAADDRHGRGAALLFERDGLGWRMTGVDLPDGAPKL